MEKKDKYYELKVMTLLSLGFGMVGIDRYIIYPLFPLIAKDLGLNYQHLGLISAVLALTWGTAAIFAGRWSDRYGEKAVLIPSVIVFSLLVMVSGWASSLASLLLIRGLMGIAEGAYVPASVMAGTRVSDPSRVGLSVGIQQMSAALLGPGLTPILATQLLMVVPSWHWVFAIVAIPGFILAYLLARVLKPTKPLARVVTSKEAKPSVMASWKELLGFRNVRVNAVVMVCWLSCLMSLATLLPSYLTDHLHLSMTQMGTVLSASGVGGVLGVLLLPALSDRVSRKGLIVVSSFLQVVALWIFSKTGAEPVMLFILLMAVSFFCAGIIAITMGPMTSASVPAHLASSATGVVIGCGEILGGAAAPALAGFMVLRTGIDMLPVFAGVATCVGFLISLLFMREPGKTVAEPVAQAA